MVGLLASRRCFFVAWLGFRLLLRLLRLFMLCMLFPVLCCFLAPLLFGPFAFDLGQLASSGGSDIIFFGGLLIFLYPKTVASFYIGQPDVLRN